MIKANILYSFIIFCVRKPRGLQLVGNWLGLKITTFARLGVLANGSVKPLFCQIDCTCWLISAASLMPNSWQSWHIVLLKMSKKAHHLQWWDELLTFLINFLYLLILRRGIYELASDSKTVEPYDFYGSHVCSQESHGL